jgi:hypothetical protein
MTTIFTKKLINFYQTNKLISLFFLLSSPLTSLAQPQIAENIDIQNCQYIKKIEGFSGYGKNNNWKDIAKYRALNQAEKLGATHVIWEKYYTTSGFSGIATGKAYSCKS